MNTPEEQIKSIFLNAAEIAGESERSAYLDERCGDDAELRREIDELLRHQKLIGTFLESSPVGAVTIDQPITEKPGTQIGPYKLLQQIGEGGMGVVYMAEQKEPVKRRVALKIIKPGMDTRQVIARFEAERQALAMMDHPNIAKVLDAGQTESGRPYFVMELVKGTSITEFCDAQKLGTRERLQLFVEVCRAVQHAHQNGIIHRDLKPSNVMVTMRDDRAIPKVIDFGVAKALSQKLTEATVYTADGQLVGTPLYMSPEQAQMNEIEVDTRSDVYSLGILLYELLTGTTPFDSEMMKLAGFDELRRIIRENEPPRPSDRVSTLRAKQLSTVSERRKIDTGSLSRSLRGDLDWIVMKALEKDRNRRYESASAFAADVERNLHDEPVEACPPSMLYRARKFVRRNATAVALSTVAAVAGLILVGGFGWMARDHAARKAIRQQKASHLLADVESYFVKDQLPNATATLQRLQILLDDDDSDPLYKMYAIWKDDLTLAARLKEIRWQADRFGQSGTIKNTVRQYQVAFRETGIDVSQLTVAEAARRISARKVRSTIVAALDDWANLTRCLPGNKPEQWERLVDIARQADRDKQRNRLRDAWRRSDLQTLEELASSADVSEWPAPTVVLLGNSLHRRQSYVAAANVLRRALSRFPQDAEINDLLGSCLTLMTPPRHAEAIELLRAANALRPNDAFLHRDLGITLVNAGRLEAAEAEFRAAFTVRPEDASILNCLGACLIQRNELDNGLDYLTRASKVAPNNALIRCNLAGALAFKRRFPEALAVLREVVEFDPSYTVARVDIANIYLQQGNARQAILELRDAIASGEWEDSQLAQLWSCLGKCYQHSHDFPQSVDAHREAYRLSPEFSTGYNLASVLRRVDQLQESLEVCQELIRLPLTDEQAAKAHTTLGVTWGRLGESDAAEREFEAAIQRNPRHAEALYGLGNLRKMQNRMPEAAAACRRALAADPNYALAHCTLATILRNSGELKEALSHFQRGHELSESDPTWTQPSADWVRFCEEEVALEAQLLRVIDGETKPKDEREKASLAGVGYLTRRYHAAAQLGAELWKDRSAPERALIIRAAVLAGTGQGRDAESTSESQRERWREQAYGWSIEELHRLRSTLQDSTPESRVALKTLLTTDYLHHSDFEFVRGWERLAKFPSEERKRWADFWDQLTDIVEACERPD